LAGSVRLRSVSLPAALNDHRRSADHLVVRAPRETRPKLSESSLTDVIGGLVLLAISAMLVAVAVLSAAS
jgi:hypothetical protein